MTRWAILGLALFPVLPLAAQAGAVSQKQADLREQLRVQQLICNAMADVHARGANAADNNFSLCFMALEQLRADYQQALAEATAVRPAAAGATVARMATARSPTQ
jgi:hypothetical protein